MLVLLPMQIVVVPDGVPATEVGSTVTVTVAVSVPPLPSVMALSATAALTILFLLFHGPVVELGHQLFEAMP